MPDASDQHFDRFEDWQAAAKALGLRVKLVTRSNTNTYYQAIKGKEVVGLFNTLRGGVLPSKNEQDRTAP